MSDYLTTKEVAELLRIKERKVYDLASSGALPCSKVIGKLLFPKHQIDAWLAGSTEYSVADANPVRPAVLLGSHDPLLEWALRESRCGLATLLDGSSDGLRRFCAGEGVAAGLHIHGHSTDQWNTEAVSEACAGQAAVLLEWGRRQRGWLVSDACADHFAGFKDLNDRRLVPRQPEAGAQKLFLHLLQEQGLDLSMLNLAEPARTETDIAQAISNGSADVGFGLQCVATDYKLRFIPVLQERYDILVDRRSYFEAPFQSLLAFCQSARFKDHAALMAGYELSDAGTVHWNEG